MDNKLRVVVSADTKSFVTGLNAASTKLKTFGNKAKDIGKSLSMSLTLPIGLVGGAAIKLASDFEESMNKVDVAFGQSSESVKDFAKTTLEQFGIAEGSALEMTSLFGDMATGMGIAQNDAANLSTSMVGLAGDLASFKNMNIEEVTTALSGVFTGETESLKRLGIVMTEVNLKQFAMEQGIKKNIKEMTQAEKVALRFQYILSVTGNAQGDFARTSGGAANQTRIFQESLKELGQSFGSEILPMFTSFIKKLNETVQTFRNFDRDTKILIITISGLVAAAPLLIAAFGTIATIIGAIVTPVGLVIAALGSLVLFSNEVYNAFVTVDLYLRSTILKLFVKVSSFINKYLITPIKTFSKVVKGFLEDGFDVDIEGIMEEHSDAITDITNKTAEELEKIDVGVALLKNAKLTENTYKDVLNDLKERYLSLFDGLNAAAVITPKVLPPDTSSLGGATMDVQATPLQGISGSGLLSQVTTQIDDFGKVAENRTQKLEGKLRSVRNLADQFGQSLMGAFETMGEGEPFFKVLMQMLGKLIKKLITAAIVSGVVSFAVNGIFGGGTLGFGAIFGSLSGIGGLSGLGGRSAFGEQSFVPKAISPGRTFGRLNANRSMQSNQLQGDFRLQGQDLVLALQRANTTRNRILG